MTFSNLTRVILLSVLAITLVWLVITRSFVAHFAKLSPETALSLRSNDATVLLGRAEEALGNSNLNRQKSGEKINLQKLEKWIRQALLESPVNARAFYLLGKISEKNSHLDLAQDQMQTVLKFSNRESLATFWLIQQAYNKKEYGRALHYINILLWHRPKLTKNIIPYLAALAESRQQFPKLVALLAQNPRWRYQFFVRLTEENVLKDIKIPLKLLESLQETAAPPTKAETGRYISALRGLGAFDLAYYSWLQFLPPEQLAKVKNLFNGDFDMPLDGSPFNWRFKSGRGASIDIVRHPDSHTKKVLNIRLSRGESDLGELSQIMVLGSGDYIFQGRFKGVLTGLRGLQWHMTCLGKNHVKIAQSPVFIGRKRNWENFEMSFTVPGQDCPAQRVSLVLDARTRSEKLASGRIWYDSLKIIPKINLQ